MNFDLSEEQQLIQDSVARFVADEYHLEKRRKLAEADPGFSEDHWKTFAELGWLALPFAEEDGGIGGDAIDVMVVMEQFGKGLVLEPFFSTVVLGGGILKRTLEGERRAELVGGIVEGRLKFALAHTEAQSRWDLNDVTTAAKADGDGFVLNGAKCVVLNAQSADHLIVSARTSGGQMDEDGISLFLVDADAAGVTRRDYPTVDGLRACELMLEGVKVSGDALVGEKDKALPVIEQVIDEATLAVGCEAVGAMEVAYKSTVEYSKQRVQFGQPIGKFQVLQHRMVDMFMEYEQSKSLMYMAAMRLDEGYGDEAKKAVSGFKVQVGKSGRFVGQQAVQLHGGMGMTEELHIGHYFKRLTMIDTLFGNVDFHLKRYGRL